MSLSATRGLAAWAFTGVSRGVIGTTIVDHADTADIVYVDAVIRSESHQRGFGVYQRCKPNL